MDELVKDGFEASVLNNLSTSRMENIESHLEDTMKAFTLAMNSKSGVGKRFNIANGVLTSINRLAGLLIELFGAEGLKPKYSNARQGDIKHYYADVREAKQHLGFESRVSLKERLLTLVKSY